MIGGHLATRTWLHGVPARLKLAALAVTTLGVFWIDDAAVLAGGFALALMTYLYLGREARARLKLLSSLAPVLVLIGLFQFWSVGVESGAAILLRLSLMILLADMVSMTTPMLDMMDAIEPALRPLSYLGLDAPRISVAVALVVRFAPALMDEWSRRNEAWRARTGRRGSLGLLPGFLASIVRLADHVAEALDARGFGRRSNR
ncbi:MAG: energy-coupling factor transporter transmembrane component T family protein [Beijerinckiaceae bacterium]